METLSCIATVIGYFLLILAIIGIFYATIGTIILHFIDFSDFVKKDRFESYDDQQKCNISKIYNDLYKVEDSFNRQISILNKTVGSFNNRLEQLEQKCKPSKKQ